MGLRGGRVGSGIRRGNHAAIRVTDTTSLHQDLAPQSAIGKGLDMSNEVSIMHLETPAEIDLAVLSNLFDSVGMRARVPEQMAAAMRGSTDACAAYQSKQLVGFGRLVSDGVYYGTLWDIAVRPDMQGRSIGSQIVRHLIDVAHARGLVMIGLFTSIANRHFYERLGFTFHGDIFAMTRSQRTARSSGGVDP